MVNDAPDEKQESVIALFKENTPTSFEFTLLGPENQQVSFKPGQDSLVSGTLVMRPIEDANEVEVDVVLKIAYLASDIVKKILSMESPSFNELEEVKKAEIFWIQGDEYKRMKKFNRNEWKTEHAKHELLLVEDTKI